MRLERRLRTSARGSLATYGRLATANVATEEEIQAVLASLASPLVGAIAGDSDSGYVLACSPTVTADRLRVLGDVLSGDSDSDRGTED